MKLTWELDAPRAHALAHLIDRLDRETLRQYATSERELYDMVAVVESSRIALKRLWAPQGGDDTRCG
ncbi:MAG: hypothetical protein ACREV8_15515 [Gammaproteobacteria bacterium]